MKHHSHIKKPSLLYTFGLVAFLASLHASLPTYFNSSFLNLFTDEKTISLIYLIASLVTIVGLLAMDSVLEKLGNLKTSLLLISLQIVVFFGILSTNSFSIIAPLFIIGTSVITLISFTFDVFLQRRTDIDHTGSVRGLYMTITNGAWLLGPLLGGALITIDNGISNYGGIYFGAFILLFPLLYLVHKNFNNFRDSRYIKFSARETIMRIFRNSDLTKIFFINTVLQTFYAWMTVYIPIYLNKTIGFSWTEISVILTIMLVPFIFIELPLGKLADIKWGEKEMLLIGFVIMATSTGSLVFFTSKSLLTWSIMLFITRIGAATAEIMIETYFFKKIDGKDPEMLSMFRITRPFSYFIAPIIVTIGLVYTTNANLFIVFGIIFLLTLFPIYTMKDTN